ncbi:uncharacterized protein LOC132347361 [Balaenoptera ricei]|uniref:uncharacterized protein LOC132347361 n=1 Tax=Balaenoptera ricei TaxID=2746895 RepID=UPI0028BEDA90|nr:uncharacterized protein LOC132347361 [Balaenoptera ricei]
MLWIGADGRRTVEGTGEPKWTLASSRRSPGRPSQQPALTCGGHVVKKSGLAEAQVPGGAESGCSRGSSQMGNYPQVRPNSVLIFTSKKKSNWLSAEPLIGNANFSFIHSLFFKCLWRSYFQQGRARISGGTVPSGDHWERRAQGESYTSFILEENWINRQHHEQQIKPTDMTTCHLGPAFNIPKHSHALCHVVPHNPRKGVILRPL